MVANREQVASRFDWPVWVILCCKQLLGDTNIRDSLLCNGTGTDSDFSGGAGGWEAAAHMLEQAALRHGLAAQLSPQSTCDLFLQAD